MPTQLSTIVSNARVHLRAPTVQTGSVSADTFWTDTELLAHTIRGCRDLWRSLIDLHQDHFLEIVTTPNIASSGDRIIGVPKDVLRVILIQPSDTSDTSNNRTLKFTPAKYNSPEFRRGLAMSPIDPTQDGEIFYVITKAGSPIAAPEILIAPRLSSSMTLRIAYIPTLPPLAMESINPIAGESDLALEAFTTAYALAKQSADNKPDTTWMAVYGTEKQSILIVSEPRQEQQPRVVRGVFDDSFGAGLSGNGWLD